VHPYFLAPTPHLFGHRGASGECPENTLLAFERAAAHGVPFLETDCHATLDGELVLLHDADVERTTNESGPIRERTWAEVQKLDAGYRFSPDAGESFPFRGRGVRVPRLAEVLEAFPEHRINLEIKQSDPPIADEVIALLRRARALDRVLLAAEQDSVMDEVCKRDAGTAIGSSLSDAVAFFQALAENRLDSFEPRGHALQIPPEFMGDPLVTPESVAGVHRVGLVMHIWTVNEPAEMRRLLDLGVDGLMSDFPGRLIEVAR
jgi:glycerophosphoryl diester phosphodiesterase